MISQKRRNKTVKGLNSLQEFPDTKPLAILDISGVVIYSNNTFRKYICSEKEIEVSSINSEPGISDVLNTVVVNRYSNFMFEAAVLSKNSVLQNYMINLNRVFIEDAEYRILTFDSINERKNFEDRISNLHNALEYGGVAVIITNEEGIINYSSSSFEKILNKNIEHLYNRPIYEALENYLSESDVITLKKSIHYKHEWIKLISDISDDADLWFKEVKVTPIRKNDSTSMNFVVTAQDITNYILKNRIIKKSEQRQKSIINNISDPLLIVRKTGEDLIFENANDNFYSVFDVVKPDVIEKKLQYALPEDLFNKINDAIVKTDYEINSFVEFRHSDKGREYQGKLNYTDDYYEKVRLFIISLSDITDQLQTEIRLREAYEKETQLSKLKSSFLANMSHEVRTPLNAIVGYSELIEDDVRNGEYDSLTELTNYMKEGVDRLLSLVDNIVEVSLLESGADKLELTPKDIKPLIVVSGESAVKKAEQKNIKINYDLCPESVMINIDENKFQKVIDVLIDNAIKYNKEMGEVILKCTERDDKAVIEICDTGIGIPVGKLSQILEPFYQADNEGYRRRYEGAGLGLTIAHRLMRILGGTFEMSSILNQGTTVKLSFDLHRKS